MIGSVALNRAVSCHIPFQNHLGLTLGSFMDLLSPAGVALLSGVFRQGHALYGPGCTPLKDPVKSYIGYSGAQKALFGSIMLIVFRGVLASVSAMVRYVLPTAYQPVGMCEYCSARDNITRYR